MMLNKINFAMLIDGCVQRSYYVKDGKSYKFNTDEPYSHHHSIGNECHLGIWGWPFLFDGYFLNWTEFNELPSLDLDVIMVAIEKKHEYNVDMIRKKYPNAIVVSFIKEDYWSNFSIPQRVEFFKSCDYITFPWKVDHEENGMLGIKTLSDLCGRDVHYVPQPHNIDFLYEKYFKEDKLIQILNYKTPEVSPGEDTESFVNYISEKYNIPVVEHVVKYKGPEHNQWEEFLSGITDSLYCFNLDTVKTGGSMAVQCAALGMLNIGGVQDSNEILFPNTATNDWDKLEKSFVNLHENSDVLEETMHTAFKKANENYSYDSVKNKFLGVVNG